MEVRIVGIDGGAWEKEREKKRDVRGRRRIKEENRLEDQGRK